MVFDRKDSSIMGEKLRVFFFNFFLNSPYFFKYWHILKQWISQEIDVSVGLAEGRSTLTKLIDERKQLACELASLQERYKDLHVSRIQKL